MSEKLKQFEQFIGIKFVKTFENKLKNELYDMYLEYELSGYSLVNSINRIKENFHMLEMSMFLSAIEQQVKYGQAFETYENLICEQGLFNY